MRRTVLLLATVGALLVVAGGTALANHPGGLDVTLSPPNETKPVYSEHTVTADVSNVFVGPAAGATVIFEVSGPDGTFSHTTYAEENGVATLTFDNSGLAGTYTISATAEFSYSQGSLSGESTTPVTVTFTDGMRPTVVESGLSPQKGATGVARDASVMATFSEVMKKETLSASTFKLYEWNKKKTKWQRVTDVGVGHATVDCTRFESICLAMPKPACNMWQEGGQIWGTCEVPTLDPYPSDPARLLGARKKYKAVITTGAQDINGEALAKAYAWKFATGRS